MSYVPGYRFRTRATFADGEIVAYPRLWAFTWADRSPAHLPLAVLDDNELVEVVENRNGAVMVSAPRVGVVGFLG